MKTQTKDLSRAWQACLMLMLGAAAIMMPDYAFADGDTPIGNILCTVVGWFTGNTGKGLATIAVLIIGIGALLGKVSWGMAIIVGVGIAVAFGAASIVNAIEPGAEAGCVTNGVFGS